MEYHCRPCMTGLDAFLIHCPLAFSFFRTAREAQPTLLLAARPHKMRDQCNTILHALTNTWVYMTLGFVSGFWRINARLQWMVSTPVASTYPGPTMSLYTRCGMDHPVNLFGSYSAPILRSVGLSYSKTFILRPQPFSAPTDPGSLWPLTTEVE